MSGDMQRSEQSYEVNAQAPTMQASWRKGRGGGGWYRVIFIAFSLGMSMVPDGLSTTLVPRPSKTRARGLSIDQAWLAWKKTACKTRAEHKGNI